ncbi:hypothetical protein HBI23_234350 [Parastagonospora nodorum]|nr:hypothetical protein HBI23_234350 [Parastagonospora nodorum]
MTNPVIITVKTPSPQIDSNEDAPPGHDAPNNNTAAATKRHQNATQTKQSATYVGRKTHHYIASASDVGNTFTVNIQALSRERVATMASTTIAVQDAEFYSETTSRYPSGNMPKTKIAAGLGVEVQCIHPLIQTLVELAKEDPILTKGDSNTQGRAYKDARDSVLKELADDDYFKQLCDNDSAHPYMSSTWEKSALFGLWTTARAALRNQVPSGRSARSTSRVSTPATHNQEPRDTSAHLAASDDTVGNRRLRRLTMDATTKLKEGRVEHRFDQIRVCCYSLPHNSLYLFSIRVSSIIVERDLDILSKRQPGDLNCSSIDYDKFFTVIKDNLEAAGRNVPDFQVYYPDADGPRRIVSKGTLRLPIGKLSQDGVKTWAIVITGRDMQRDDEKLKKLCDSLVAQGEGSKTCPTTHSFMSITDPTNLGVPATPRRDAAQRPTTLPSPPSPPPNTSPPPAPPAPPREPKSPNRDEDDDSIVTSLDNLDLPVIEDHRLQ